MSAFQHSETNRDILKIKFEIHIEFQLSFYYWSAIAVLLLGSSFTRGHQGVAIRASLRASLHPTAWRETPSYDTLPCTSNDHLSNTCVCVQSAAAACPLTGQCWSVTVSGQSAMVISASLYSPVDTSHVYTCTSQERYLIQNPRVTIRQDTNWWHQIKQRWNRARIFDPTRPATRSLSVLKPGQRLDSSISYLSGDGNQKQFIGYRATN